MTYPTGLRWEKNIPIKYTAKAMRRQYVLSDWYQKHSHYSANKQQSSFSKLTLLMTILLQQCALFLQLIALKTGGPPLRRLSLHWSPSTSGPFQGPLCR